MPEITPLLIAAALLTQYVIAQHIGLRVLISLREAIGVSATVILTSPIAALIDWLLLHTVLQSLDIAYLRLFIVMVLTAAIAPLIETLLRVRYAQWFPPIGSLLPLTMTTCCTLIAAQIARTPEASLTHAVFDAIALGFGAAFLLLTMQALREYKELKPSLLINSVANDILHAAFILVALRGVVSIW
ncbi:MAG TPA: Rnf-Nqr domain containing protein [Spongiibacteraceae bacterium]|nr:Rnf-Nqr domain containing protein [Spongiibacteraceae bacterium]